MKFQLIIFLILYSLKIYSQNINGNYIYLPSKNSKTKKFQIEISYDSIYKLTSDGKLEDHGTIRRKEKYYYLISCCLLKHDPKNKYNGLPVKFTNRKMKVYGLKPKYKKLTKAFELIKASI
jgi:hypothetical protein